MVASAVGAASLGAAAAPDPVRAAPAAPHAARAAATPPVRFTVRFGAGARLGRSTPVTIGLRVDPAQVPALLTRIRILTPADLDVALSGLGLRSCRRPDAEFRRVFLGPSAPATCPDDALLATGSARADLRFGPTQTVPGDGTLRLYSGAPRDGVPGLAALVATTHPLVGQLAYRGEFSTAPAPFGLGIAIRVPAIPEPPFDATVALVRLDLTLGGRDIVYTRRERGHVIRYRPGGIPMPDRCPRGGFRFRVLLGFDDGTRRAQDTVVPCPRTG